MTQKDNLFRFTFQGNEYEYELHELTQERIRNLSHIDSQDSPNWFIDMYVATIDGVPAREAPSKSQWLVYGDSQDFLAHVTASIGRVGSQYESPEAQENRDRLEEILKSSRESG